MIVRLSYCFLKIGICQGQMISWGKLAAMKKKTEIKIEDYVKGERKGGWGWGGGNERNSF